MKKESIRETRTRCADRLRESGLRVTRSRLAVYEALCRSESHPTAEELYRRLGRRTPGTSMATVYNCLEALTRSGLIGRLDAAPGAARYEAETQRHHHMICRHCGRVEDIFDPELDALSVEAPGGFKVEDHAVHFFGLCADCRTDLQSGSPTVEIH